MIMVMSVLFMMVIIMCTTTVTLICLSLNSHRKTIFWVNTIFITGQNGLYLRSCTCSKMSNCHVHFVVGKLDRVLCQDGEPPCWVVEFDWLIM